MSTTTTHPSMRECRAAAASLRGTRRGRAARRMARPRSGFLLFRAHPPMPVLLWLRARQGMLVWEGPDCFLLFDRVLPIMTFAQARTERRFRSTVEGRGRRLLAAADEHWAVIAIFAPATTLLVLSLVSAVLWRFDLPAPTPLTFWVALALPLLSVVWVGSALLGLIVRGTIEILGQDRRRALKAVTRVGEQLPAVAVLHARDGSRAAPLVAAALRHPPIAGRLLLPARAVSSEAALHVVQALPHVRRFPADSGAVVVGIGDRLQTPPDSSELDWSDLRFVLGACLVLVGGLGVILPDLERSSCQAQGCDQGEPVTVGAAVYWLVTRLVTGGDPNGVGPTSLPGRVLGTVMSIFGVYILVTLVGLILTSALTKDRNSYSEVVDAFNAQFADQVAPLPGRTRRLAARVAQHLLRWAEERPEQKVDVASSAPSIPET